MSIVWHKKSVNRILINGLEYVYILLLILGSRSLYAHPLVGDYRITEMFLLVSMLLFIVNLDGCRNKLSKRLIVSLLAYMFVAGVYAILGVPGEMMVSYIGRYIVLMPVSILLLYTYSQKCETHVLLLKIPNVMCVLSIISLFFWLFGSTLGIIKPTGTYASLWGDHLNVGMHRSYYGIYFDSQSIRFFGYSGFRNCGIFTEAPMHSMMLVFAISCELFYGLYRGAKLNIPKLALLSFTVITTFSSTGIVLLLLCFGLHVYIHLPSGFQKRVLLMGLTVPAVIAMAYVAYKVVSERSSGTSSWLHRLYGNRTALEYFIKSPIIGTGYGGDEFKSTFTINNVGFAFTITAVLAEGGILLSSVYWIPVISTILRSWKRREKNIACFAIIYFAQYSTSLCENALIMFVLLAAFIVYVPQRINVYDMLYGFKGNHARIRVGLQPQHEGNNDTGHCDGPVDMMG